MRISPVNSIVQQNNYSNKNINKQSNNTTTQPETAASVSFKGRIVPNSIKYLTGGFGSIAAFVAFPNPATFVSMFLIGGLLFTAAACTYWNENNKGE